MNFSVLRKFYRLGPELGTSGSNREGPITYKVIILIVAIFVFSIFPIVWYQHLPLGDYPNHLARVQIHKTLSSNPYLSNFYDFHWTLTPYLGFELLALPFMYYLPVELAGKIAIVICFLMIYGGTILLDRQLNHDSWGLSLFSGIFFYFGTFKAGYMPYVAGIAFVICAFWIWIRYREKADGICVLVFIFSGILVSAMHLFAFGVYAICVASYECSLLWKRLRVERRLRTSLLRIPFSAAVSLIVPMLVWFNPLSGSDRPDYYRAVFGPIHWGNPWWAHGAESTLWISLAKKVDGLASPIFYSDPIFEIPLLLIIFAIFVWALATRAIVQNPRMIIPLGAFAGTYLVMPYALGEIGGLDYRFPSAVAFIALVSFGWGKASPARINVVRLLLAVCLIVRVGSVFSEWQPAQAIIAEYDTALRLVPPGSRLLVIVGHDEFWGSRKQPLVHIPELPAAKRGILDPLLFDIYGGTLLNLKPDYRGYSRKGDPTGASRYSDVKSFDYLMEIRQPPVEIPAGITLDEIERGRTFVLYRIEQQRLPSEG